MDEETSIERTAQRLQLLELHDVADIGGIPRSISEYWNGIVGSRIVLTGERKRHILERHPEMQNLWTAFIATVRHPDEIHHNKRDPMMVIFWRRVEYHERFLRVAVLLSTSGELRHSVMSAWQVRRRDFERERRHGRTIWVKGT